MMEGKGEKVWSVLDVFGVMRGELGTEKEDMISGGGGAWVFLRLVSSELKASSLMKQSPMSRAVFKL
jgi:hypothetical protein